MAFKPGRILTLLVILGALGGGGYYYYRSQQPVPVQFNTAKLSRGNLTQSVTATGTLEPVEKIEVSSQISAIITEVPVDYNSAVKKGDVLARLDPATYQSRLNQAEAQLANTQANHTLVKLNADRVRSLRERNLVSQQELDQANAQLEQAEAQLKIQRASVETAKVDLTRCVIDAPIDGTVLDRQATVGKTVAASLNAPTLFILVTDLRKLQINAAIAEADIGNVREGQTVHFTVDAFPNRRFDGTVAQIRNSPTTQSNVVTYATIIAVNNDDLSLKPGMTANVSVVVNQRRGTLLVSNSALRVRLPEDIIIPLAEDQASAANSPTDQVTQLLLEAGNPPGQQPTREIWAKVRALATERGIVLPSRRNRGSGGNQQQITTRTLYKPAGTPDAPLAQSVAVKLGVTDGINTEILEGLADGDEIITGIQTATTSSSASSGAGNPFAPQPRRRF
ncbi:efflux RND transporter periplasmic adaptor subunit [Geminisphaera colitermitum]|uniref:efflux RND transporter periplasmic adaptor subunit n=1 Tax=Geminisphaera colitermitum TaxID=1148786 RepID=UPI0001964F8D|nr:efflux RND transporter periplasmic adaptor subunit [Geminisphaera colitermitum]